MIGKSKGIMLALLLLFSLNALAAGISVSIGPKNRALEILQLYPDEIGALEVSIVNNGTEVAEKLNLRISVEGSIALLNESTETNAIDEQIPLLSPEETKQIFVDVKAKEPSSQMQYVYLDYGFEKFTHIAATYIEIIKSPLELQASLEKRALDLGEGSKIVLSLNNDSNSAINNVSAELVLPAGISAKSPKLFISSLYAGEGIANKEFPFDVEPQVSGKKSIILLVSFEDSLGRHALEKDFTIEVQDRKTAQYVVIIAIIVLIAIMAYATVIRGKGKKKEEPKAKAEETAKK